MRQRFSPPGGPRLKAADAHRGLGFAGTQGVVARRRYRTVIRQGRRLDPQWRGRSPGSAAPLQQGDPSCACADDSRGAAQRRAGAVARNGCSDSAAGCRTSIQLAGGATSSFLWRRQLLTSIAGFSTQRHRWLACPVRVTKTGRAGPASQNPEAAAGRRSYRFSGGCAGRPRRARRIHANWIADRFRPRQAGLRLVRRVPLAVDRTAPGRSRRRKRDRPGEEVAQQRTNCGRAICRTRRRTLHRARRPRRPAGWARLELLLVRACWTPRHASRGGWPILGFTPGSGTR